MSECVFCMIAGRKIPSSLIFENEGVIAILDIHPNTPGHALVIPRLHARNARDLPSSLWSVVMEAAAKVGDAQMRMLGAGGFHVVMNNESAAEQVVFHAHAHVIPRYTGDGLKLALPSTNIPKEKMQEIAQKLKHGLQQP